MDKIGIIVVINRHVNGCVYYRQIAPHIESQVNKQFEILITDNTELMSDEEIKKYHIVQRHKGYHSPKQIDRLKKLGLVTIVDFDDYWNLPTYHILYKNYYFEKNGKRKDISDSDKFRAMLQQYDYVTVTTPLLADEVRQFNPNVEVFENAINPEAPMWEINHVKDNIVRFGYFGGSTHWEDVQLLRGTPNKLWQTERGKYNLFLFGHMKGSVTQNYLDIFTDYKRIMEPVKAFPVRPVLHSDQFSSYVQYYNFVDAVLVPLKDDKFNSMKSELKLVEAGFFHKPVIVSDVWPYRYIANENNALLVKKPKDWYRHMRTLINEPELRKELGENLYKTVKEKYDVREVNKKRADFYKKVIKK